MSDIAELGYSVDTGALVAGQSALDALAQSTDDAAASHDRLTTASGRTDSSLSSAAASTRDTKSATDQYVATLKQAADANDSLVQNIQDQRAALAQAANDLSQYSAAASNVNKSQSDLSTGEHLLASFIKETGNAVGEGAEIMLAYDRILVIAAASAIAARAAYLALSGQVVDASSVFFGLGDKISAVSDYFKSMTSIQLAAVAAIGVGVTALAEYESQTDEAADAQAKLDGSATTTGRTLLIAGAGFAAAAGAVALFKSAMNDLIAVVDKGSDTRLGATMILALQTAAAGARVSVTELNSALEAITKASKSDPSADTNNFYKALTNIGPAFATAFKDANSQTERIKILSDAFHAATTETQKYQLAQEALATQNDRVIAMFDGGRSAIDAYQARMQALGITVDDSLVEKSAKAQAQMAELYSVFKDKLLVVMLDLIPVAGELAPKLEAIAKAFVDIVGSFASIQARPSDVLKNQLSQADDAIAAMVAQQSTLTDKLSKSVDNNNLWTWLTGQTPENYSKQYADNQKRIADLEKQRAAIADILLGRSEAGSGSPKTSGASAFKAQPSLSSTKDQADEYDRLEKSIDRSSAAMEASITTIGQSDDAVAKANITFRLREASIQANIAQDSNLAQRIQVTADRYAAAKRQVDLLTESYKEGRARAEVFLSDADAQIAERLAKIYPDITTAINSQQAAFMRVTNAFKDLKTDSEQFFGDFLSGLQSGKTLTESLESAVKNLATTLANQLGKFAVDTTLQSIFGGAGSSAALTTGATSAATILTTAGASVGASIIAGATSAASILGTSVPIAAAALPIAGTATGVEVAAGGATAGVSVAAGGVTAGAAVAAGGVTAGVALWGPVAALAAAVAAIGVSSWLGSKSGKSTVDTGTSSSQNTYDAAANTALNSVYDTTTHSGALAKLEADAQNKRNDEAAKGNKALAALEYELAAERTAFDAKWAATAKKDLKTATDTLANVSDTATETRLKAIVDAYGTAADSLAILGESTQSAVDDFNKAIDDLRDTFTSTIASDTFTALGESYVNDISDLEKKVAGEKKDAKTIAAGDNTLYQSYLDSINAYFQDAAQKIVDDAGLTGTALTSLTTIFPDLTTVLKAASAATTTFGLSIKDYLDTLLTGSNSPLSGQQKIDAAQSAYNAELALAQGGDKDAKTNLTKYADTLLSAEKDFYASSTGYADAFSKIADQLAAIGGYKITGTTVTAARMGGVIGYAAGGIVSNGIFDVDSVRAHFASGGDVALAGGEFVTRAPSVNSGTLPILDAINRTGSAPSSSADGRNFDRLGRTITMAIGQSTMAHVGVLREEVASLRTEVRNLGTSFTKAASQPARPGSRDR